MTYLQFHLVFMAPALAAAGVLAWRAAPRLGRRAGWALFAVPPIALAYTTPWDNYLVWKSVWAYGTDRVVGVIGYVPVEEYVFFLLQPLLVGCVLYAALGLAARRGAIAPASHAIARVRVLGALPWLALALAGIPLLRTDPGTYLGLILVWAAPVPAVMWLFMGPAMWRARRPLAVAIALPTIFLWIADRIAIGLGIWTISTQYTLGFDPFGLPVEEAVFFLMTCVVSAFGVLLFLGPGMPELADR